MSAPRADTSPIDAPWHVTMLVRGGALHASSVLARCGTEIALFDTGFAHHAPSLLAALAAEGVHADDVTLVFNTHAHVDHSHNNALFRRARIFGSARDREWTHALHEVLARVEQPAPDDVLSFYPEIASGAYNPKIVRKVLAIEKLLWDESRWGPASRTAWLEHEPPPAGIGVMPTPGHAPHHVSFVLQTATVPVLVCGDALLERGDAGAAFPLMAPWSLAMYRRSQERIAAFDGIIVPGHDAAFLNGAPSSPGATVKT